MSGGADEGSEFHYRGRPSGRIDRWLQGHAHIADCLSLGPLGVRNVGGGHGVAVEEPGQHPSHIRVKDDCGQAKGECLDSSSGVLANAG